jgi:serralysin
MATISQVTDRPLSGLNHIDALIGSGVPWNFIGRDTIHYSFALPVSSSTIGQILDPATVTAFNAAQAAQVRVMLSYLSQLTGIHFEEWSAGDQADLHFGNARLFDDYTSQTVTSLSYANQGGQAVGLKVDAWIYLDAFANAFDNQSPAPGGIAYQSLLHELGHALGLKHPFEGPQQLVPGDALGQDNTITTLMSYNDLGTPRVQFGAYDVAALAWLYGGDGLGGNYGVGTPGKELVGSVGNDFLQGSTAADIVMYTGARSAYAVANASGGYTVSDRTGVDGVDTLAGIERIHFSDLSVNLTAGTVAAGISTGQLDSLLELYIAYLNRTPDSDGMVHWIGQLKAGVSLARISQLFYDSAVIYGSVTGYRADNTNTEFVQRIYSNVLGRDNPDAEGLAFWTNALAQGRETRGSLVATMLYSAHTYKGREDFGWVADLLDNKIAVGKLVSIDKGVVYNTPEDSITHGMEIAAAITPFSTAAAISLIGVPDGLDLLP